MPLSAGVRFGPYEVLNLLGAGGMGEVYRARDTRLKRDVAIKVLPDGVATDPERLARFHREAELLASLNHPNIAAIYGLEESPAAAFAAGAATAPGEAGHYLRALVLELVEGETLAERLARGPMRFSDAMAIARQLVEALDAAHGKGVIHRDLKPANIKITPDDKVKVLDFGLATVVQSSSAQDINVTQSPTLTINATRAGVILGTAAYMSPEQASGSPADKRADVWAFGVVLWEMLTGRRIFEGETVSHTLAFVITKEPDWSSLPADTPPSIRRLLRRCLEKDRKRRLPDIASAQLEIEDAESSSVADGVAAIYMPSVSTSQSQRLLPWAFGAVATITLVIVVALWAPWRTPSPGSPVRVVSDIGADASLGTTGAPGASLALSPDGRLLAFIATNTAGQVQLYLRPLNQLQATALAGTADARDPFFSPDSAWVGFFANGQLKKISIAGGPAVTLCDAPSGRGGSWAEDDTIVFAPDTVPGTSIFRVSSAGGKPERLTTLAPDESLHRWPQSLKGGQAVLFTAAAGAGEFDGASIVVQTVADGTRKTVHRRGYFGRYLPSGHLTYISGGTLFAAPFDLGRLEMTGQPVPVVEGVGANSGNGATQHATSANGTLVYRPGLQESLLAPMTWVDRGGQTSPLRAQPSDWSNPSFSPDGKRVAMDFGGGAGNPDVWIYEWTRDIQTKLTFGGGNVKPVWTPDGNRIVFSSTRESLVANLFWQRADGSGEAQRLTDSKVPQVAGSWHPNGHLLAFAEQNTNTGWDIQILPVDGDEKSGWKIGKPTVFLNGPFNEQEPMFSPDGRWIAYFSNEGGPTAQVFVRPFPGPGGLKQISSEGGIFPSWSRTRPELLYRSSSNGQIMVASYMSTGNSFEVVGQSRAWSSVPTLPRPRLRPYALHTDGERLVISEAARANTTTQGKLVFVFNFFDELRRIAPSR
jgi:serine/threonine-protein kinase